MIPPNMPLPQVGPTAVGDKPPLLTSSVAIAKSHKSFESSMTEVLADKVAASELSAKAGSETDARVEDSQSGMEQDGGNALPRDAKVTTAAHTDESAQARQKKDSQEKDSVEQPDPHGTEGTARLDVREQVAKIVSQAQLDDSLPVLGQTGQTPSADEILLQLAALAGLDKLSADKLSADKLSADKLSADKLSAETFLAAEEGRVNAGLNILNTGAGIQLTAASSATLPSSGLAFLAAMLAQAGGESNVSADKALLSTADSSGNIDLGLRLLTNHRGGQTALVKSGPPLSAHSPTFADELLDRVGRMRVFSRGSGASEQQVRVTLVPEELGAIDLRMRVDAQNRVHMVIMTETDAARDLLNRQMSQLRDALERQNMEFGEVTVHVDDQKRGGEEMAQWGFGEQRDQLNGGMGRGRGADEIVPEIKRESAISASDGGLSIFV